jgi:hypothetical protein
MTITRRQLVTLGAAGAAGAMAAKLGDLQPAAARSHFGGIHIHVLTYSKQITGPSGPFPHTFIVTLWGPDNALSGTGVGFTDGTVTQNLAGGMIANCVIGVWGKIEGDVLRGEGVMAYSADPDERRGQRFPFEANLATGFCRFSDVNMGMGTQLDQEGVGTVTRI